ncbi:MAG: rRNA maturation RNase YbeY [Bacteroidales bacterium]|nr:rRNA maturation RNase YbeY [Bacteroidales bacterium]
MAIYFTNHQNSYVLKNKRKISNWIKKVIKSYGKELGSVTIIFSNDDFILEINKQYLKHNYFTDIITFDYSQGRTVDGDIFISLDTVLDNSKTYNSSFDCELLRVIIHGILHLLGFKDKKDFDKTIMTEKENKCLELFYTEYE